MKVCVRPKRTTDDRFSRGGHITAAQRHALPASDFAGPGESYPVDTKNRARNALARVAQFGDAGLQKRVRQKVHSKYPEIGED